MALCSQWEYSHAASAVLNVIALVALICGVSVKAKLNKPSNLAMPIKSISQCGIIDSKCHNPSGFT